MQAEWEMRDVPPHCIIHAYGVDDDNQEKSNIEKDDNT